MTQKDKTNTAESIREVLRSEQQALLKRCKVDHPQELVVEPGEAVSLSPTSSRFESAFVRLQPSSIQDVRQALGFPEAILKGRTSPCGCGGKTTRVHSVDDLDHEDESIKGSALGIAHRAVAGYVMGGQLTAGVSLEMMDRFIQIVKPSIFLPLFGDIIVQDTATLNIAKATHALYANRIRMYGSGQIVCDGPKTIRCNSLQGKLVKAELGPAANIAIRKIG